MNKRYQVFISSTYADLQEERSKVSQTIMELDCIPAGMELFPAIDEEQFEFIKKVIDDCDYYILVIGGRYGTLTEEGISYTEKEYNYAIEKNIKILAFIHANPEKISFEKSESDGNLREKLEKFKEKIGYGRLVKFWKSADELPGLVSLSLSKTIKTYPAIGWVRANEAGDPELYKELNDLRKDNQLLKEKFEETKEFNFESMGNIADLESKIIVRGQYGYYYDAAYFIEKWQIDLSWNEIFYLFSPFIQDSLDENNASEMLARVLKDKIKMRSSSTNFSINMQDYQTIKIQLQAMGLVRMNYVTSENGRKSFWNLTEKGVKLMFQLRILKKS